MEESLEFIPLPLLLTYSTISSGIWLTYIVYNQEP